MSIQNIKEMVGKIASGPDAGKDKLVFFKHYKNGELWYVTEINNFEFPVPVSDTGDATFAAQDKAILFMRWIRKHMMELSKAKAEEAQKAAIRAEYHETIPYI